MRPAPLAGILSAFLSAVCAVPGRADENLIENPSFENTVQGRPAVLLIKTEPGQTVLNIAARVGAPAQPAAGWAWFDQFVMEAGADEPRIAAAGDIRPPDHAAFPRPGWGLAVFALLMLALLVLYALLQKKSRLLRAGRWRDILLAGGLILACAVISFSQLGSADAPQTYYQGAEKGQDFILDLGAESMISEARYFLALGAGSFTVDFSTDRRAFFGAAVIEQAHTFSMIEWRVLRPGVRARYVRVTTVTPGAMLGELALFGADAKTPLPVHAVVPDPAAASFPPGSPAPPDPRRVFDEPGRVPAQPSYLNGMYFDECYHARSAYEYVLGRDATETSHPPLGKLTISAGILLFGFTPFGWRCMGALFGMCMVPLLYALALRLFKKSQWAFVAAFLLACDFMRFTQTRIATIDVFGVFWILGMFFFMHRAVSADPFAPRPRRFFRELFFAGVCLGVGAASKWIALYAAAGLAAIFIGSYIVKTVTAIRSFRHNLTEKEPEEGESGGAAEAVRAFSRRLLFLLKRTGQVFAFSVLAFFILPAGIYLASYIPFMAARGPAHPETSPLHLVLNEQIFMYNYHAGITETHTFSSPWYDWPVMNRPIWYYTGRAELPPSLASDIYAFGNPAVWWPGIAAAGGLVLAILMAGALCIAFFLLRLAQRRRLPEDNPLTIRQKALGRFLSPLLQPGLFVLIALAAQYVPWIVIPRQLTFIYHFFASVPFIILCIVLALKLLSERWPRLRWAVVGWLGLALLLFLLFYPLLSGALTNTAFVETFLRWFPGWFQYL